MILGGVVIACLATLFFVISFFLTRVQSASHDLSRGKEEMVNWQKKKQKISDLEGEYKEIQSGFAKIDKNFLEKDDFLPFILTLEKIARESDNNYGNRLISESSKEDAKSGWPTAQFQITLKGDFSNLLKFLTYLENMPYIIEMTDLMIQRGGQGAVGTRPIEIITVIGLKAFLNPGL